MDIALHDTYYVVAQMGLNNIKYSAIDYMLGTISSGNYLLFIDYNLRNYLDVNGEIQIFFSLFLKVLKEENKNLLLNSENNNYSICNNMDIQSAENCKGFSETIRQLFNSDEKFYRWLAGIIDGNGNFDIRNNNVLKSIRIKLHNRFFPLIFSTRKDSVHPRPLPLRKN